MKSKASSFWQDQGVFAAIMTFIALCVGFFLDQIRSAIGTGTMVLSIVLVIAIYIIITYIAYRFVYLHVINYIDEAVVPSMASLRHAVESLKAMAGQDWLISREQLLSIESKVDVDEIWIISQALEEETDTSFTAVVTKNLGRSIKYVYFVPDQPAIRARTEEMRSAYMGSSHLQFIFVSDELFALVAPQDIVIFGPVGKNANHCAAYMNIPISTGGNEYFIRLGSRYIRELIGRLRSRLDQGVRKLK